MVIVLMTNCLCNFLYSKETPIAYFDALKIAEIYHKIGDNKIPIYDENSEVFKELEVLLTPYLKPGEDIRRALRNPYLKEYFETPNPSGPLELQELEAKQKSLSTLFSSGDFNSSSSNLDIAGLDVTNIARGIAQFMIERAKAELTVAFFNRFQKFADKNEEFKVLFPITTTTLEKLLTIHYAEMLDALRTAFITDLENLADNFDGLLNTKRFKEELIPSHPEIVIAFKALKFVKELEWNKNPAEIIESLATVIDWDGLATLTVDPKKKQSIKNIGAIIQLSTILSNSLRNKDNSKTWIDFSQLRTLLKDKDAFNIYSGLIYELVKKESIEVLKVGTAEPESILALYQEINPLNPGPNSLIKDYITDFILIADKVELIAKDIENKRASNTKLTEENYFNYIDHAIDIVEHTFALIQKIDSTKLPNKFENYIDLVQETSDLFRFVYKTEYAQAVVRLSKVLSSINDLDYADDKNYKAFDEAIGKITKYGLFAANMTEAESPEEVKTLLESSALPVGSSSIKKNSKFNISVQSYLGAYWLLNDPSTDDESFSTWDDNFGVHAPIGIAFSLGFRKGGSISLFPTLLDIGAIVDYELTLDTILEPTRKEAITKDYKIQLGQIFSPGGYVVYGFPCDLPLSLGIGAQYGPGLARVETDGQTTNSILNNPRWRMNVFLSVDIPFFNVFNRNKDYRSNRKGTKAKKGTQK